MNRTKHNPQVARHSITLPIAIVALLTVVSAASGLAQSISVAQALNNNLFWTTTNYTVSQVVIETNYTHDGVAAVEFNMLSTYGASPLPMVHTTVIGPGTVSFWYQTYDQPGNPFGLPSMVYGDMDPYGNILWTGLSADGGWSNGVFSVGAGVHNLTWGVVYDETTPLQGMFLDEVSYTGEPGADATPVIFAQPQAQGATVGSRVSFRVEAVSNSQLSFQWRKNGSSITDGGRITGATTDTLTISDLQLSDLANYSVIMTNGVGWTNSSDTALMLINQTDGSLGFRFNQFGFNLYGPSGTVAVVEASTNLLNWLPLSTNTLGGSAFYFTDPGSPARPSRWYRVR